MKYFAGTTVVPTLSRLVLALAFITAGYNKLFNDIQFTEQEARTLQALEVDLERRPADLQDQQLEASRLIVPVVFVQNDPPAGADPDPDLQPSDQERTMEDLQEEIQETGDDLEDLEDLAGEVEEDEPPAEAPGPEEEGEFVYYGKQLHSVTLVVEKGDWPYPKVMAWVAAMTEFFGGICLLIGFLSRFWALGIAFAMASAFYLVSWNVYHIYEFVNHPLDIAKPDNISLYSTVMSQLGLFVLSFGIVLTGAGPLSLDRLLFGRRGHHRIEVVKED